MVKYPELKGICKKCLGCNKLENYNFVGVNYCKWYNNKIEGGKKNVK